MKGVLAKLMLLGATGDLSARYLLPALATLCDQRRLLDGFEVVGVARSDLDDASFRQAAARDLEQYAGDVPAAARESLLASLRYRPVDLSDPASLSRVVGTATEPLAVYLALPPSLYATVIRSLRETGLPTGSRVALEKPFGESLDDAVALNRLLTDLTGPDGERGVFRVDHVLGLATVQNLITLRMANRVWEPVWDGAHIDEVNIYWEEELALEGRAGYFDRSGTLRDVMQNHMLQVLCLIAMTLPDSLDERQIRDRRVEVLRRIRPPRREEMASRTRRARYTAGTMPGPSSTGSRAIPSYVDEDGVDPDRGTETFAEVLLTLDHPRWSGTRFRLRAGKALHPRRKQAVLRFRQPSTDPLGSPGNELRLGLDGPNDISLRLTGGMALGRPWREPLNLEAPPPKAKLPAYGRVLLDILDGDCTLSVRNDESEAAWRVMTPVLQAWAEGLVPLEEYPAGSSGPPPL